jgi:hypothetical protein
MLETTSFPRVLAIAVAASLIGLAGPAAIAAVEPSPGSSPAPSIVDDGGGTTGDGGGTTVDDDGNGTDETCTPVTIVIRPERTLHNGKVIPAKTRTTQECRRAERDQLREDRAQLREDRAQLRADVRAAGGTWGAVQRQATLIRVAQRLAEHHAQAPTSAALGRILTLINTGLPTALQIDIVAFLAQYDLNYEDLVKAVDDEVDTPDPSPSPSA